MLKTAINMVSADLCTTTLNYFNYCMSFALDRPILILNKFKESQYSVTS